jgi:hypothetical protein
MLHVQFVTSDDDKVNQKHWQLFWASYYSRHIHPHYTQMNHWVVTAMKTLLLNTIEYVAVINDDNVPL